MASGPAVLSPPAAYDEAALRRRNDELERAVRESEEREWRARAELERTRERLRVAEESEERLCFQLGELEADAVEHAREYHMQIVSLREQLAQAQALLRTHSHILQLS